MTSRMLCVIVCALPLALAACGKLNESRELARASDAAMAGAPSEKPSQAADKDVAAQAPERRYLAVRHQLQIVTEADGVEAAWRNASEACAAAQCEVLSSTLRRNDEQRPANAFMDVRVPPEKLDAFLQKVTSLGSVGEHTKSAEDKTAEVVDVEARIKNTAEFRDNLRRLMATPGAKLKDIIEVERELVRVQGDLDSFASRRKALAGETDKVHVTLTFTAKPSVIEQGMWAPVKTAVVGAGHLFAHSLGGLIEFVVLALPWAALLSALVFAFLRWKRRRAAAIRVGA